MINTRKAQRRTLRFDTIAQLREELARLEAANAAGTLKTTGNWSVGQILGHLAAWIDYAYDGYPMSPPLWVRAMGRLMKPFVTGMSMPPGVRIYGAPAGTYGGENLEFAEGLRRMRAALDRLEKSAPTRPSPMFGRFSHEGWKRLNLNHAALHLGYVHP